MGKTLDRLKTGSVSIQWVLAIEGVPYLVTDGSPQAALDAWAAVAGAPTEAIGGLLFDGMYAQSIDPWRADLEVPIVTFRVVDCDGTDRFGIEAHRRGSVDPTTDTYLEATLAADETSIFVTSETPYTAAAECFIGVERIAIDSTADDGEIVALARGLYAPFKAETETEQRWGRHHKVSNLGNNTQRLPVVSQTCRSWLSKWVEIRIHGVVSDGVLDSYAESHRVFAGRIKEISDNGRATIVVCEDVRSAIRDKVLMADQFVGKAIPGVYLQEGWTFEAWDAEYDGVGAANYAVDLVVTTGATPGDHLEIETGYHTVESLLSALNSWLANELALANLSGTHYFALDLQEETGEHRVALHSYFGGAAATTAVKAEITLNDTVCTFLGIDHPSEPVIQTPEGSFGVADLTATASRRPYKVLLGQVHDGEGYVIECAEYSGSWIDQGAGVAAGATLPQSLHSYPEQGSLNGILEVEGHGRLFVTYDGDGVFSRVRFPPVIQPPEGLHDTRLDIGIYYGEPGDLILRQIVMIELPLAELIPRLFASTGALGYNHADYDDFDAQLGCAIPWPLLGDNFLASVQSLDADDGGSAFVELTQPRKLVDVLASEFLIRMASLVWKNQGLRFTAWQTASSLLAVHTLDAEHTASAMDGDDWIGTTETTDAYLRNVIKLEYNRGADGKYHGHITLLDHASIGDVGSEKIQRISCANSVAGAIAVGQNIEGLAASLLARLPLVSEPLTLHVRPISPHLFEDCAPGDQVTVTDPSSRDPRTGERNLSGVPGIIMRHWRSFGGPDERGHESKAGGEVTIALNREDRTGAYCPCAEVDQTYTSGAFTNGYDPASGTLRFQAHRHSEATDVVDVANFAVNDEVTLVEIDPPNSAAPTSFPVAITDVDAANNEVTVTPAPAGILFGAGLRKYRMIARAYASTQATQKVNVFQADDADNLIQDVAAPYQYGHYLGSVYETLTPATELPSRHADLAHGDGVALDVGYERDIITMLNNLAHVKCARIAPRISEIEMVAPVAGTGWFLLEQRQVWLGHQKLGSLERLLSVAVFATLGSAAVGTKSIRVTLASKRCSGPSNNNVILHPPYNQVTFTIPASTTWATSAIQDLSIDPIAGGGSGDVWLIVEGETYTRFRGLSYLQLGVAS